MGGIVGIEMVLLLESQEEAFPSTSKLLSNLTPQAFNPLISCGSYSQRADISELMKVPGSEVHARAPDERRSINSTVQDHVNRDFHVFTTSISSNSRRATMLPLGIIK